MEVEFNTSRSKSYQNAINRFPNVWDQDLLVMHKYLCVKDKEKILRTLAQSAVPDATCYIFDIFTHNSVAKFFDSYVAHACTTGHEVSFLSRDYAKSLCNNTGCKEG
ncbi:hypothetical protein [Moritella yayanosii]|uniref:Uncharacterized protein n=1 Tax=Moritella yayanosii TaxID=69539 RepID=A0A330LPL5_9GAMM|nr:hypothetical protein [Moritella yayanosii]SQD78934.1 protein of unknown function [Moritella yayanosii]